MAIPYDDRRLTKRHLLEWGMFCSLMAGFFGFFAWTWESDHRDIMRREGDRLSAQARIIDLNTAHQMERVNAVLLDFSVRVRSWRNQLDGMHLANEYLQSIAPLMSDVELFFYIDENGIGRAYGEKNSTYLGGDYSDRPYFLPLKAEQEEDKLYISEPFLTLNDVYLMNAMRVIKDSQGKFLGAVGAGLSPRHYRTLLNSTLYASDMWVSIAHGQGTHFMMEPERPGYAGKKLNVPGSLLTRHLASGKKESNLQGIAIGSGEHRFAVVRTVDLPNIALDQPLILAVTRDTDEVFRHSSNLQRTLLSIFAIVFLAGAVSLYVSQKFRAHAKRASWISEHEISERDETLRRFFFLNFDLFAILDEKWHFTWLNASWKRLLGYDPDSIIQHDMSDFIHPDDHKLIKQHFSVFEHFEDIAAFTARVKNISGQFLEVEWHIVQSNGQVFISGRDVTESLENKRKIEKLNADLEENTSNLQKMAFQDGLTLIYNRRYFDEAIISAWREAEREGKSFAILMLDIDQFKLYNDKYGHQKGDECLRKVAQQLKSLCRRPRDVVARYGGEEFVALLPDTDLNGALSQAQLIVQRISKLQIEHEASTVLPVLTVSVGVAVTNLGSTRSPDEVLKAADKALYRAKNNGRNRAEI